MKNDTDEASEKRRSALEETIAELEREYADLDEIWTAEKASVNGAQQAKESLDEVAWVVGSFEIISPQTTTWSRLTSPYTLHAGICPWKISKDPTTRVWRLLTSGVASC